MSPCLRAKGSQVKKRFPTQERSSEHQQVLGNNEPLFRFWNPANYIKSCFEEQKDYLLVEAKSEVRKQGSRADYLDSLVPDLQRENLIPIVWKIFCANQGCEASRREEAFLHEELAQRERVLRDSRIRNIHEVEELKKAQEMRIDEFSRCELRESHATLQGLTSQMQELQERVNYMNDSEECQDVEAVCSGKFSHVPSQVAVVPSPRAMSCRDRSLRFDTWKLSGTQGNVFGEPRAGIDSSQTLYQGILHSWKQSGTGGNPVQKSAGRLVAKGEDAGCIHRGQYLLKRW